MVAKYQTTVEVKRIKGVCPAHKEGDKFVLDDDQFNLKETTALCMRALQAFPFWCVFVRGSDSIARHIGETNGESEFACPMPGEPYTPCGTAIFKIKRVRLDKKEEDNG